MIDAKKQLEYSDVNAPTNEIPQKKFKIDYQETISVGASAFKGVEAFTLESNSSGGEDSHINFLTRLEKFVIGFQTKYAKPNTADSPVNKNELFKGFKNFGTLCSNIAEGIMLLKLT